jgi:uroporphyrin-III C-methyltransferase
VSDAELPIVQTSVVSKPAANYGLRWAVLLGVFVAIGLAVALALLWQRLDFVQSESARRLQLAEATAAEAKAQARSAAEELRQAQTRLGVAESKLADYSAQRSAIDRLLSDSAQREQARLLADVEQLLLLAEQESQIAGSPAALLAALKTLEGRAPTAPAGLRDRLLAAVQKDADALRRGNWPDRVLLINRFDELTRLLDDIPLLSDAKLVRAPRAASSAPAAQVPAEGTWRDYLRAFFDPILQWVEVRRVDSKDALLLSPEQGAVLRENLKLLGHSARSSLLARHAESYQRSVAQLDSALKRYADLKSPRGMQASQIVGSLQEVSVSSEAPRAVETRALLASQGVR